MSNKVDQITFVCCVESGSLEAYTVRMVESLRRWGGHFANAPLIAVTPRLGSPLSRETQQIFEKFSVQYLRCSSKNKYSWFNFINKPLALVAADEYITTEAVCWLDSDLLIVDEPNQLFLKEGEDFLACASDKEQGTSGPQDPLEPMWQAYCQELGLKIDDLPWIITEREKIAIRLYWNSGIFVYRHSTHFAQNFLQVCTQLLDQQLKLNVAGYSTSSKEMTAVVLAMIKMGLSWRALSDSHNLGMSSLTHDQWYNEEFLRKAKIVHYHDAMWPWFWPTFLQCMQKTHPEVSQWLSTLGPMENQASPQWKAFNKILRLLRQRKKNKYEQSCQVI